MAKTLDSFALKNSPGRKFSLRTRMYL